MIKNEYNVIGVMSGTSLDGIDLAYMTLKIENQWRFTIHNAETIAYPNEWVLKLKHLITFSKKELHDLDNDYTIDISKCINDFIAKHHIEKLDAICSHGHTALHQPQNKVTYQIGNRPELAKLVNRTVVCDFRTQDVAFGGQGAPLVPIGDALLFSEYDFCLNLGGFANISFEKNKTRMAHDICPVNIVLNHYANQLGLKYDEKGQMAKKGTINFELLNQLNSLNFYKEASPKSLGLEWVNQTIFPLIDTFKIHINDILRTFVEHIAIQISKDIQIKTNATVLITGGGTYNEFLIERLKNLTTNKLIIPENNIIEYKEALIFGFLGVLKLRNEINCLSSVTGAKHNHSSGKIYFK